MKQHINLDAINDYNTHKYFNTERTIKFKITVKIDALSK